MSLTQARLKELLDYNPETGVFTWKVSTSNRVKVGAKAGHTRSDGYHHVRVDGKLFPAHRLAWLHHYGFFPTHEIDHRNHVTGDNRIDNLREATHLINSHNRRAHRDSQYGHLGVNWSACTQKWQARIYAEGKHHYLGVFTSVSAASAAYQAAKLIYHPTAPVAQQGA